MMHLKDENRFCEIKTLFHGVKIMFFKIRKTCENMVVRKLRAREQQLFGVNYVYDVKLHNLYSEIKSRRMKGTANFKERETKNI